MKRPLIDSTWPNSNQRWHETYLSIEEYIRRKYSHEKSRMKVVMESLEAPHYPLDMVI